MTLRPVGPTKVFLPLIVEPLLGRASRRPMSPPRRLRAKRSIRNSPHSGTILERELGDGEFFVGERLTYR